MYLNRCTIIGNIGHDPALRYTRAGVPVVNLTVATQDNDKRVEWHNVVLWHGAAVYASRNLQQGDSAWFEGKMTRYDWTDADGVDRSEMRVMIYNVLGIAKYTSSDPIDPDDADLPF